MVDLNKTDFDYKFPIQGGSNFNFQQEPYYAFLWKLKELGYKFNYLYPHFDERFKSTNPRISPDSPDIGIHMWYTRQWNSSELIHGMSNYERYQNVEKFIQENYVNTLMGLFLCGILFHDHESFQQICKLYHNLQTVQEKNHEKVCQLSKIVFALYVVTDSYDVTFYPDLLKKYSVNIDTKNDGKNDGKNDKSHFNVFNVTKAFYDINNHTVPSLYDGKVSEYYTELVVEPPSTNCLLILDNITNAPYLFDPEQYNLSNKFYKIFTFSDKEESHLIELYNQMTPIQHEIENEEKENIVDTFNLYHCYRFLDLVCEEIKSEIASSSYDENLMRIFEKIKTKFYDCDLLKIKNWTSSFVNDIYDDTV